MTLSTSDQELDKFLAKKSPREILKWVYDHGQLKGEFPQTQHSKLWILDEAEKALQARDAQRDAEIERKARIDELERCWREFWFTQDLDRHTKNRQYFKYRLSTLQDEGREIE